MRADWDTWFLDVRYEKNATSLMGVLKQHFPYHIIIEEIDNYIRLVYDSEIKDEFGSHKFPVLVHAYCGFDSIEPYAIDRINNDNYKGVLHKTIIGARFCSETRQKAPASSVRCIALLMSFILLMILMHNFAESL